MKKLLKRSTLVGALALMLTPTVSSAHFLGYDSVDSGEIRWGTQEGTTKWSTARSHAISTWDAMGAVNIAGDTSTTIEDLSFRDVNYSDVTWSGQYDYRAFSTDVIDINNYFMNGFTDAQRKHTFLHELGHALGLDHHTIEVNVMRSGFKNYTTLGTHDKSDYNELWK